MATERSEETIYTRHVNPCLAQVRAYVPGPTAAMISARYGIPADRLVKLSSNEAPLGPSPGARAALKRIADGDDLHRYPSPTMPNLRRAMARCVGVAPEQILPGAGSTDTWPLIVRAFSLPGDEVLWIDPSMTSYGEVAILGERRSREVTVDFPFAVTADAVRRHVTARTRVIFLCSPNNTTSRWIDLDTVKAIAEKAPDAIVVVDEHYIEAADDYRTATAVNLLGQAGNVIVTRSLSKMYGLAGVRVGYAVGPVPAIDVLMQFKPKWNISILAEAAALAALEDEDHLRANIAMTRGGRAYLEKALGGLPGVELVPGAQGGFLLFRTISRPSSEVVEGLFKSGVMVRGDLLDRYIRVSVGTPEQNEAFVGALEAAL